MGLTNRLIHLGAAIGATAMMTCSSTCPSPEPLMPDHAATTGHEQYAQTPTIEGDTLDFAVRHSFYHAGQFEHGFIDMMSQNPRAQRHEYHAEFFITEYRGCYVGVIHLADECHEMDIFIGDSNAFPDDAPGSCENAVHYREAGGEWVRLSLRRQGVEIRIRGAPAHVDDDVALLMFGQFLAMYTRAVQDLHVQERIMADYNGRDGCQGSHE